MFRKLAAAAASLAALTVSALAAAPTVLTQTMHEKADATVIVDVSESGNMGAVYMILGLLVLFVFGFWFAERKNRKAMKDAEAMLTRRAQEERD